MVSRIKCCYSLCLLNDPFHLFIPLSLSDPTLIYVLLSSSSSSSSL